MHRAKPHAATLLALLALLVIAACHRPGPTEVERWNMTPGQIDSAEFAQSHHYTINYNFRVTADSLILLPTPPREAMLAPTADTLAVRSGEHIVVADIRVQPADTTDTLATDSVWIKVAKDQDIMGWVGESLLLHGTVPDDSISRFIMFFSSRSVLIFLSLISLGLFVFIYKATRTRGGISYLRSGQYLSFYPALFCLILSGTAAAYGTLRHFAPDLWEHYYYNPTLNPFGCHPLITIFLVGVWSLVICSLSLIDDMRRRLPAGEYIAHLLTLAGVSVLLYVFFTFSVRFYIGYLLLALLWSLGIYHFMLRTYSPYRCGRCNAKLRTLGRCPKCGATNE